MSCQIRMQKLKTTLEFSLKVRHFVQVCPIGKGAQFAAPEAQFTTALKNVANLLGPNLPRTFSAASSFTDK